MWVTITYKHNVDTTFVTCYCPCEGIPPGSVYSQHVFYMVKNTVILPENMICLHQLFGYNLKVFIEEKWKQDINYWFAVILFLNIQILRDV